MTPAPGPAPADIGRAPVSRKRAAAVLMWAAIVGTGALRATERVVIRATLADGAHPLAVAAISCAAAAVVAAVWLHARGRRLTARQWTVGAGLGVLNIAVTTLGFTWGLAYVGVSVAGIFPALLPVAMGLFAAWLLRERLTVLAAVGVAVSTLGVAGLLVSGSSGLAVGGNLPLGAALAMGAVTSASLAYVLTRKMLATSDPAGMLVAQLAGGAVTLGTAAVVAVGPHALAHTAAAHTPALAALAALSFLVPQAVMFWLLARTSALRAGLGNYFTPVFGVAFGMLMLGERPAMATVAAGGVVVAGAALTWWSRGRSARSVAGACSAAPAAPPLVPQRS